MALPLLHIAGAKAALCGAEVWPRGYISTNNIMWWGESRLCRVCRQRWKAPNGENVLQSPDVPWIVKTHERKDRL